MKSSITVGMDMGDKNHSVCVLDKDGEVQARATVANTAKAIRWYFEKLEPCSIAVEAGTHSGWVSRLLEELGHTVLVGNPRKLRMIWNTVRKDDEQDAEMLARIARMDPHLLHPIHHRSAEAYADNAVIKARDMLVRARASLISHCRGAVKAVGERISSGGPDAFHIRLDQQMPEQLRPALEPVMKAIEELTVRIRHCNHQVTELCVRKYPETERLRQITGIGPVTSLAFVLKIEQSDRFQKSRMVGPYLGLVPRREKSGQTDKQLPITKAGDVYLRRLLVGSAQYILGSFGSDCDLRRFGQRLAARGGKNAKRRAVVAVARKLGILMHHLWESGEVYDPFHQHNRKRNRAA